MGRRPNPLLLLFLCALSVSVLKANWLCYRTGIKSTTTGL